MKFETLTRWSCDNGLLIRLDSDECRRLCSAFAFCLMFCLPSHLIAQNESSNASEYILTAADGWPIHVTYFEAAAGRESPVIVLLTAANGDEKTAVTRRIWTDLATHLQTNGFAVVSVDLRKHGDSVPEQVTSKRQKKVLPVDYQNMVVGDMEAVKSFLMERHEAKELNVRKLAIVASGASGLVGAAFALNDWNKPPYQDAPRVEDRTPRGQDVRAIVMFSPRMTRGFNAAKIMRPLNDPAMGIAMRFYHSTKDRDEEKVAKRLFRFVDLKGDEYDEVRSIEAAPASGEEFFQGKVLKLVKDDLTSFFTKYLKELRSPWRSRVSPLEN